MKRVFIYWGLLGLLFWVAACVDKISFKMDDTADFAIVVAGNITDQPGPYEVEVSRTFDLEAQAAVREPITVKSVVMSDDAGNSETLTEIKKGTYHTNPQGLRGVVGRAYKLRVEMFDGRVYETTPDTMRPTGIVTDIRHQLVDFTDAKGKPAYGFDIFFDAQAEKNKDLRFLWNLVMTYQITTNPEAHVIPCNIPTCPDPKTCKCYIYDPYPCSGFILNDTTGMGEYVFPCECCQCWKEIRGQIPVVSNGETLKNGIFTNLKAGRLPITAETMMYKTHVEVQQYSLSPAAFNFWKAVRAQKDAATSLFQPLSGKITGNFVQLEGTPGRLEGLFYASSVSKNSIVITVNDVPDIRLMITTRDTINTEPCMNVPGATILKPDFW